MVLGIGSYTYPWAIGVSGFPSPRDPLTPEVLIARAAQMSVTLVQICDNMPLHRLEDSRLDKLRDLSESWGLRLEVGTRGVEESMLTRYLDIAKRLNARLVRSMISLNDEVPDRRSVRGALRNVLPAYENEGIVLALENYERHSCRYLADLVKGMRSPALGVCLDTVNSYGAMETPADAIRLLGRYSRSLHIKDFKVERTEGGLGFRVSGAPACEGMLDVPWLLDRMSRFEDGLSAVLELWTPYEESVERTVALEMEWSERSLINLRRLMEARERDAAARAAAEEAAPETKPARRQTTKAKKGSRKT